MRSVGGCADAKDKERRDHGGKLGAIQPLIAQWEHEASSVLLPSIDPRAFSVTAEVVGWMRQAIACFHVRACAYVCVCVCVCVCNVR